LYRPVPEIRVNFIATDSDRRFKSQYFIISILEDEVHKNPKDTRYAVMVSVVEARCQSVFVVAHCDLFFCPCHSSWFYLARTYSTVGNHSASIRSFRSLASISSWDEEIYEVHHTTHVRRQRSPFTLHASRVSQHVSTLFLRCVSGSAVCGDRDGDDWFSLG
jgi:hypothetical protein